MIIKPSFNEGAGTPSGFLVLKIIIIYKLQVPGLSLLKYTACKMKLLFQVSCSLHWCLLGNWREPTLDVKLKWIKSFLILYVRLNSRQLLSRNISPCMHHILKFYYFLTSGLDYPIADMFSLTNFSWLFSFFRSLHWSAQDLVKKFLRPCR